VNKARNFTKKSRYFLRNKIWFRTLNNPEFINHFLSYQIKFTKSHKELWDKAKIYRFNLKYLNSLQKLHA